MSKYKAILFDADGTVLDFDKTEQIAFIRTMQSLEIDYTIELFLHYKQIVKTLWKQFEQGNIKREEVFLHRFNLLFNDLGINKNGKDAENRYQVAVSESGYIYDDVIDALEYCFKKYDLYIITNGEALPQMRRMKETKIDKYFKCFFLSDEVGFTKPQTEFFDYVIKNVNCKKEEMLIVGDSIYNDIMGGINNGIDTIWINREGKDFLGKTTTIVSLRQLKDIL